MKRDEAWDEGRGTPQNFVRATVVPCFARRSGIGVRRAAREVRRGGRTYSTMRYSRRILLTCAKPFHFVAHGIRRHTHHNALA